jgi:hypothetical protein
MVVGVVGATAVTGVMQLGAQHATMKPLNKKIKLWQK